MIENIVGTYPLPLAIATNFAVNGKDFLIPMGTPAPAHPGLTARSHRGGIRRRRRLERSQACPRCWWLYGCAKLRTCMH